MTLWFKRPEPKSSAAAPLLPVLPQVPAHSFKAWTESFYVAGVVRDDDRLSDLLNRRLPIAVERPTVIPFGAPRAAAQPPDELVIDPFDFDFVLAPVEERLSSERAARRIHKVRYPVLVEGRNFEVRGMLHLFAGNAPEFAMHHTGTLFLPVTNASVRRERRVVSDPQTDVVLVNRYAIRSLRQLDTLN